MALPKNTHQRENEKFKEVGTAVTVQVTMYDADGNNIGSSNPLPVSLSSDIQIGAVEIKDESGVTRATVTANKALLTQTKEVAPTDTTRVNGSLVITRDSDGNPTTVAKTISGTTYTKTLTWVGGNLTSVSSWS